MSADNPFVAMIARYSSDENGPVLFVREILGATPEAYQEDLLARDCHALTSITAPEGCRVSVSGCPKAVITHFFIYNMENNNA